MGHVFRVVSAVQVVSQVAGQQAVGLDHGGGRGGEIEGFELLPDDSSALVLERVATRGHWHSAPGFIAHVGVAEFLQVFARVPEIEDEVDRFRDSREGVGEALLEPRGAISASMSLELRPNPHFFYAFSASERESRVAFKLSEPASSALVYSSMSRQSIHRDCR